jgi:diguanylate cyclase (GGDEF)-like protein
MNQWPSVQSSSILGSLAAATLFRDRDELDQAIARLLLRFLEARSVSLFRLVEDGGIAPLVCRVALSREPGVVGADLMVETAQHPSSADISAWAECVIRKEIVTSAGADGHLVSHFPLCGERGVQGMLVIDATAALTSRETDLVHDILQIMENHLALLDYGERDTLTGLLNRKTFEVHFEKLRQRLTAGEKTASWEPSWLALIDIDRFKSINDSHGHLFGDEVLLLVSQLMSRTFRGADQLFRFGGEEFVVVLDRTSEAGAQIAFERLRTAIETQDFPQVGRVTVSLGYTCITSGDTPTTSVERADAALYHAKNHGRNCIHKYESLLTSGDLRAKLQNSDLELF